MDLIDRLRLDHPIVQAGMGNMSPATLAAAVARSGGLGTIGTCAPSILGAGIDQVRQEAPGRAQRCVNLEASQGSAEAVVLAASIPCGGF